MYRTITKAYYKGVDGVLIVFDLTDRESFNNIDSWLTEVQKYCGNQVNIIIIANKCDVGAKNVNLGMDGAIGGS